MVCRLVIALELDYRECKNLIKGAGYILNRDPFEVDRLLVQEGLKPLFSE